MIEIKEETKRQVKTKRRETKREGTESHEGDSKGRGDIGWERQRGTPRASMWRSIEQIYKIHRKKIYT
jgi:hypothetical protein